MLTCVLTLPAWLFFRFILPSEAYGLIHGIKSLYSPEPMVPPYQPRTFEYTGVQKEVQGIHELVPHKQTSFEAFIRPFEAQYDTETCLKLVREEVLSKIKVNPNRELNYIKELHISSRPVTDQAKPAANEVQQQPESPAKVCLLPRPAEPKKKQKDPFKHEWHSPQKAIFKPFFEVSP